MSTERPTAQFSYRSQQELAIWNGHPLYQPVQGFEKPEESAKGFEYCKYGHTYAYALNDCVKVFNAKTLAPLCEIKRANVVEFWFSPQGNFLATWERQIKLEDGSGSRNLMVWDAKTGKLLNSFAQKAQNSSHLQWTDNERYCARLVPGELYFYENRNFEKPWSVLRLPGITQFSLSPGKTLAVFVFIPERDGAPAVVRMYSLLYLNQPISHKTFYKADKIQLFWNSLGTSLLIMTQTEVDKTGKSYYGETNLYYLATDGHFDCRVPLDKEGSLHDVTWSPNSREFVVVYGSMPAKATLFNERSGPVFSFGVNPRNFVRFNPQGRIICVAGFGNLNGTVDLWDRKTFKKITTFQAPNASHCEWSPCGRFLMTATLTPRLRVDNGFKLWHYTGQLIYEENIDHLYQIKWRPESVQRYPSMRTLSPAPAPVKINAPKEGNEASPGLPAGAYRPPHLRNKAAPTVSLYQRSATNSPTSQYHRRYPDSNTPKKSDGRKGSGKKENGNPRYGKNENAGKPAPTSEPVDGSPRIALEDKTKRTRNTEKKPRSPREYKPKANKPELVTVNVESTGEEVTV
ncbi:eukaryotic translation initiation factor eIF2A-domain-containing protein [Radiomyces spectabilis]|uniref:eukaryotic translation initiation factor eIF2A-domain-containing protein n=1 Tax=Radiomyces spectabilis TaxID=64574 RepID=UPI002221134F|nr:eukaryotic translation initiation factor eIF2A-domain-containing protein [Radiomyces spectabilis]KAI8371554.1 eukaryotic translation initiation factor eIF2A-domain-containing protein [Radiomyces spectabilis]